MELAGGGSTAVGLCVVVAVVLLDPIWKFSILLYGHKILLRLGIKIITFPIGVQIVKVIKKKSSILCVLMAKDFDFQQPLWKKTRKLNSPRILFSSCNVCELSVCVFVPLLVHICGEALWLWLLALVTGDAWHAIDYMWHVTKEIFFFFSSCFSVRFCLFWYRCYYPHTSRDLVSPVCRIFYM